MTRAELVKFLEENYEANEVLLWQTMSFDDVENIGEEGRVVSKEAWIDFVEDLNKYNPIAEQFSEATREVFFDYLYNQEPDED